MKSSILAILTLFFFSFLQGCIPTVVMGTAAVGTKIATDPRTIGEQIDDSTLTLRINRALSKNKKLKEEARINIMVYKGNVLLVGQAPNQEFLLIAEKILSRIKGVNTVFNEIRQEKPISSDIASIDTWITTKVRSQFLINNLVKSSNIKIITENGEVFLFGSVTESEGKIAANVASHISGVRRVVTAYIHTV